MAFTVTVVGGIQVDGRAYPNSRAYTCSGVDQRQVVIGHGTTNVEVDVANVQANRKAYMILSDQPVTMKLNNSGTPDQTVVMAAGAALSWDANSGLTDPLPHDITKLFFTNAGATDANVTIVFAVT